MIVIHVEENDYFFNILGSLSTSVTNLLGSSLDSNNSDNPGNNVPTHIPFENRDQPSNLSDLAKMMYAVRTPVVWIFSVKLIDFFS